MSTSQFQEPIWIHQAWTRLQTPFIYLGFNPEDCDDDDDYEDISVLPGISSYHSTLVAMAAFRSYSIFQPKAHLGAWLIAKQDSTSQQRSTPWSLVNRQTSKLSHELLEASKSIRQGMFWF
ncbi:hypothetical protein ACET3Z_014536 [Daucus carota]